MGVLRNPRWERFAQNLAAGMKQTEAYAAAGYREHAGAASKLRKEKQICERLTELHEVGAIGAQKALTAKQDFIAKAWKKAAAEIDLLEVGEASDLRAIVEAALAAEKDQRVTEGGVSDRQAQNVTTNDQRDIDSRLDGIFKPAELAAAKPH